MKTMWKVFKAGLKSNNGDIEWKVGEWQKYEGKLGLCASGFHASEKIIDAMFYMDAELIAKVEVRGDCLIGADKQCWSEMRILEVFEWTKEDSVAFAVFAAEQVIDIIDIFETRYPEDDRPRKAIEAAKNWLKEKSKSARAAAWAARAAARAAALAAREAAWAAGEAAWAAGAAGSAWAAGGKKVLENCEKFILSRLQKTAI